MKNVDTGGREATSTDLSHTTSSPLWTPGKKTDFTNTREPKLKHTIYTVNKKDTYTQREMERGETRTTCTWGETEKMGGRTKIQIKNICCWAQTAQGDTGGPRIPDGPTQRSLSRGKNEKERVIGSL